MSSGWILELQHSENTSESHVNVCFRKTCLRNALAIKLKSVLNVSQITNASIMFVTVEKAELGTLAGY